MVDLVKFLRNDILLQITLKKRLFELWNKYNFNIEEISGIFIQSTWNMNLFADYKLISVEN